MAVVSRGGFYTLIDDEELSAGYYTLSTYLAGADIGDPNYQADFSDFSPSNVPEPASLSLLGTGLVGLGLLRRRKQKTA